MCVLYRIEGTSPICVHGAGEGSGWADQHAVQCCHGPVNCMQGLKCPEDRCAQHAAIDGQYWNQQQALHQGASGTLRSPGFWMFLMI